MFIIENRNGAATAFENFHDLFEELVPRIKRLALRVLGIVAVFADEQHAVDGEFGTAQRQRVRDRRKYFHTMAARAVAAQVALGKLIHVESGQLEGWLMVPALPAIAFERAVEEMLRVGIFADLGGEQGD